MIKNQAYFKYIFIGGVCILFFLIIISLFLSNLPKKTTSNNTQHFSNIVNNENKATDINRADYVPSTQKINVTPSQQPETTFNRQLNNDLISPTQSPVNSFIAALNPMFNNNVQTQPLGGQQQILLNLPSPTPTGSQNPINVSSTPEPQPVQSFINALNPLFNFGNQNQLNQTVETGLTQQSGQGQPTGLTYYPQCDGPYDNYSLVGGCNICQAGCGQTTTAMILSSYVDKKFTPPVVADLYAKNGVVSGCKGTNIMDAQNIMKQNGVLTTDLIINSSTDNTQILSDFKSYLRNGWTLFTLARYCSQGCGHFIWIVDVDSNNNVWTYDSFYGRKQIPPPFNENKYNPFPYYRVAFGVKKP